VPADSELRRVYFSKARLTWYLVAIAFVVILVVIAFGNGKGTGNEVIGAVLAFVVLVALVRWAAAAVIAGDDLTVRNPLRTYRIAWSEIERIYQDGYSFGLGAPASIVAVKRKDGQVVRASALITYVKSPRRHSRRYSDEVIADLLDRTQQAAPGIVDQPVHLP
jgi:hypothetical protein